MINDNKLANQIASGVIDFLKKIKREEMLGEVVDLLSKEKSKKRAMVYAPVDLKTADKKKITLMLKKLTGENIDSFTFKKDESLIDGLKIFYKDRLWDFSMASQIEKLDKIN